MSDRAATFAEKAIAAHAGQALVEPGMLVGAHVDLVVSDELSFPGVLEEFHALGATRIFDPARVIVVADHETPARNLLAATSMRDTRRFADEHGIRVLDAGRAGIMHVVLPELGLVAPGELVMGYDSHVLTAGALGALGIGVGATDAAVAMAFGEMWLRVPESVRILIEGTPDEWARPMDVGLAMLRELGQAGCLYQAVEYGGTYPTSLGMDGRFTLANIAIELGAKSAACKPDDVTRTYLESRRSGPYETPWADAGATYAAVHEFDVDGLGPLVALPDAPDRAVPIDEVAGRPLDQIFIGTCTNGRLSDLRAAAAVLKGRTVHERTRLIVIPGSPEVYLGALREGLIEIFAEAGAVVGPPGCGPCAGLHLGVLADGEVGLATSSRNFPGRMGGRASKLYLASPVVAAASAVAGAFASPREVVGDAPEAASVAART